MHYIYPRFTYWHAYCSCSRSVMHTGLLNIICLMYSIGVRIRKSFLREIICERCIVQLFLINMHSVRCRLFSSANTKPKTSKKKADKSSPVCNFYRFMVYDIRHNFTHILDGLNFIRYYWFSGIISGKFAINWSLWVPPHLSVASLATLPCEYWYLKADSNIS